MESGHQEMFFTTFANIAHVHYNSQTQRKYRYNRVCTRNLWCDISSSFRRIWAWVLAVAVTTQVHSTLNSMLPQSLTPTYYCQWDPKFSEPEYGYCVNVCNYILTLWVWPSILSWGAIHRDLFKATKFPFFLRWKNLETIVLESRYSFHWGMSLSKHRPSGLLVQENAGWLLATWWHSWSLKVASAAP